ncbi:unnamed protein product [Rhodiola kirilowii]
MPTLNLYTNIPVDAVTASDILKDATKAVAKIIGKPDSYVMILLNGGVPIAFAGTAEPAAYAELVSIGGLGPGVNGKLSSTIAQILQTKLSIESSRFYIKFYDVEALLLSRSTSHDYSTKSFLAGRLGTSTWFLWESRSTCSTYAATSRLRSLFGYNGSSF